MSRSVEKPAAVFSPSRHVAAGCSHCSVRASSSSQPSNSAAQNDAPGGPIARRVPRRKPAADTHLVGHDGVEVVEAARHVLLDAVAAGVAGYLLKTTAADVRLFGVDQCLLVRHVEPNDGEQGTDPS